MRLVRSAPLIVVSVAAGLFVTVIPGLATEARGGPISVDIKVKGEKVGAINVDTPTSGNDQGVKGSFDVTKTKVGGGTMTVQELEAYLKQDHMNWFQKVTKVDPKPAGLDVPFVDPPSGGLGPLWADDRPWYWDEVAPPNPLPAGKTSPPTFIPPAGQTELSVNTVGSQLKYEDFPGGQAKGTVVDFSTFLISDYGNKTYSVLGGFTWEIKIQDDGSTKVTSLTSGATFTNEFAAEIKTFGWTLVPEPSSYAMMALGALGVVGYGRARRRKAA